MPQLLTTRDVADYLGVSVDTVQRLVKTGALPAIKLGPAHNSRVRFQLDDIQGFVNRQRTTERRAS